MEQFILSEINIYPVKSLGGITMNEAKLTSRGLQFDRRWMLVDENNVFISQREINELCLFKLNFSNEGFNVRNEKSCASINIPIGTESGQSTKVTVWNDTCEGINYSDEVNNWFSKILNISCKLIYMPDTTKRSVNKDFAINNDIVSFADGYPILMIGQSALDNYNNISGNNFKMNRFRPNLVFTGGAPHIEDTWKKFTMNDVEYYGVKPCGRCVITTIEQETGITGKEPLATLAKYRTVNNSIKFGMNVISGALKQDSFVKVGSEINVVDLKMKDNI